MHPQTVWDRAAYACASRLARRLPWRVRLRGGALLHALAGGPPAMRTRRVILLCETPRMAGWQLEPLLSGRFVLLGWQHSREDDMEGGLPDDVASLLARSLTRVALV